MSENVILAGLRDVSKEIKHLTEVVLTNTATINGISDDVLGSVKKQVFTMRDLAHRWNCSARYAHEIVNTFKIPLVLGKSGMPRQPHCVFKFDLISYERRQADNKLNFPIVMAEPSAGKTARGFVPHVKKKQQIFSKGARLGDLRK